MNKYIRILGLGFGLIVTSFIGAAGLDPIGELFNPAIVENMAINTQNAIRQGLNVGLVTTAGLATGLVACAAFDIAHGVSRKVGDKVYDFVKDKFSCSHDTACVAFRVARGLSISAFMVLYGAGIYKILQNMPKLELIKELIKS